LKRPEKNEKHGKKDEALPEEALVQVALIDEDSNRKKR